MLHISPEQFAALEASADRRHAVYLTQTLDAAHPGRFPAAMPEQQRTAIVVQSMSEARSHGVTEPSDIDAYVEANMLMGPGFASRPDLPWVPAILGDSRAAKGHRLLELARIVLLPAQEP